MEKPTQIKSLGFIWVGMANKIIKIDEVNKINDILSPVINTVINPIKSNERIANNCIEFLLNLLKIMTEVRRI